MNWHRVKEQGELFPTFYPRTRETIDAERVTAREGGKTLGGVKICPMDPDFPLELRKAVRDELWAEKVKEYATALRREYRDVDLAVIKREVEKYLKDIGYPKEWRIKKRIRDLKKAMKEERGY